MLSLSLATQTIPQPTVIAVHPNDCRLRNGLGGETTQTLIGFISDIYATLSTCRATSLAGQT